jgi:hypothetical protein
MHDVMIGVGGLAQGKKKGKGKGGSKTSAVQSAKEAVQAMHPPPGAAGTSKARAAPAAVAGGGPSKVYTPSALDEAKSLSTFDLAELEEKLDAAARLAAQPNVQLRAWPSTAPPSSLRCPGTQRFSTSCGGRRPSRRRSHGSVKTPLPSNSPHDHMILKVDLVDSCGKCKRSCHQTAPECDQLHDAIPVEYHTVLRYTVQTLVACGLSRQFVEGLTLKNGWQREHGAGGGGGDCGGGAAHRAQCEGGGAGGGGTRGGD